MSSVCYIALLFVVIVLCCYSSLLEMVKIREKTKRELMSTTLSVVEKRYVKCGLILEMHISRLLYQTDASHHTLDLYSKGIDKGMHLSIN